MLPLRSIVVAVDFEEPSRAALRTATGLARELGASVTILHTVVDPNAFLRPGSVYPAEVLATMRRDAELRLEQLRAESAVPGVEVSTHILAGGAPAQEIVDWARAISADLVVVGTHGRSGLGRIFLGSVAERVLRTSPCPVLVAR